MSRRKALLLELIAYWWASVAGAWTALMAQLAALLRRGWVQALLLVMVTLLAYGPAWRAGFVWDDDVNLTRNPVLTASDGLRRIWFSLEAPSQYIPLTYTSFYLEHALWGLNPAGYHLVNLLLHALNAVLVWQLLKRLTVPGAWLAGALFALHPVQVESAAWLTERENVLMGFFFLLTLREWIQFIDDKTGRPRRFYFLALVFCGLALLAKTTACTLPAALLLILWFKKIPIDPRRLLQIAPFAGLAIAAGLVTVWWEHHRPITSAPLVAMGLVERILMGSRALWFYLGKLVWPVNLAFSYPHWTISTSNPSAYCWLLATIALAVAIWWARRWTGRGVEVAAAFFVLTLSPMLGLVMIYTFAFSFVADHYQYLACIGPLALAAAGIQLGFNRAAWLKPYLQRILCGALLIALGTLTWVQCGTYADAETLWRESIARNPDSWLAQMNLGSILLDEGDVDVAITRFRKAIEINPALAKTHDNLGIALARSGQLDEAISEYQKTLAIDPNMAKAHEALGVAWLRKGKTDQAISEFNKALALVPHFAGAENSLGIAFAKKGQPAEAMAHFQKAVEDAPNDAEARSNLGMSLAQHGKPREAIAQFQKILDTNPADMEACNNLAWVLATTPDLSLRDGPRAVVLAQQAREIAGQDDPVILHTLALAYAATKDYKDAISTAQRALVLAVEQNNDVLAGKLRAELESYQGGVPSPVGLSPGMLRGLE